MRFSLKKNGKKIQAKTFQQWKEWIELEHASEGKKKNPNH